ncbi:hypothetical protein [Couchioplanes caeruleus]|uniref:Uncharacterized protein n=2 Tax=Couchioplanes caeruleus TaxID=56438 RepID=A0A1K0GME3_9ACTN|nr:hypothetical protein [Couchioplanes caeruleus]OJF12244.1 hypothetical protein BG844_21880 [Couchioplanes caeruleus subsp. caeruleus]ROP32059.1 hypothetical protein EDD30_4989 [Couchioplanes caeruleus]
MRVFNRRSTTVVVTTVVALGAAGAAWAAWRLGGAGTGVDVAGSAVELELQGRSDTSEPLYPGASAG